MIRSVFFLLTHVFTTLTFHKTCHIFSFVAATQPGFRTSEPPESGGPRSLNTLLPDSQVPTIDRVGLMSECEAFWPDSGS